MAEFVNAFGKVRGKFGNVISYVGANGKNYCRAASLTRKAGPESQKRRSVAFGTVSRCKRVLARVIRLGFPGGNGYPAGFNGFTSANVASAVSVEKIAPDKEVSPRKRAPREFKGTIDYEKLRVAAGRLEVPVVHAGVDAGSREVAFRHEGELLESVDCFLDDEIYGVTLHASKRRCLVKMLGTRGETFDTRMNFPEDAVADGLIVYVFARSADGKDASDSVCLRQGIC